MFTSNRTKLSRALTKTTLRASNRKYSQLFSHRQLTTRIKSKFRNLIRSLIIKDYLDSIPTPHILIDDHLKKHSHRKEPPPPKPVLTSHCTLIIVPSALVDQWTQEIYKVFVIV